MPVAVRALLSFAVCFSVSGSVFAESVIIRCKRPCDSVVQAVEKSGGKVTHRFRWVDAIAADVSPAALNAARKVVSPAAIRKDVLVDQPQAALDRDRTPVVAHVESVGAETLDAGKIATLATEAIASGRPDLYSVNNAQMDMAPLHQGGYLGTNQKVAVIDSGIRPGRPLLDLDSSVIGGEDFVGDGLGFSNPNNGGHGTFVAGMISGNVTFTFAPTSALLQSVNAHCPTCVQPGNRIPLVGTAPLSKIYALRVFGPVGGAPESRIIAAMERVLDLKAAYRAGQPEVRNADGSYSALNIGVCNMSLGGTTLYAGRDLEDELTNAFNQLDIVLVASAGNNGPSGSTGGSPGTGFAALTVGAASTPVHERVLRDVQFGLGIGAQYRPFNGLQTAYFSSRGPTADGRVDPEVVANGFGSIGQGFSASTAGISLSSGTSFSAPTVSGIAATLREAMPAATAQQVRNAIILSADKNVLGDGSGPLDQGAGFVSGSAALDLLRNWLAPDTPGEAGKSSRFVTLNIHQGAQVPVYIGTVTRTVSNLRPGQRFETYYRVTHETSAVTITLSDVVPGAVQNPLFGDDILLTVHSAKTSAIGASGDYEVFAFTQGGTFVIPNPEQGLMRITVNGDWTNASPISAKVAIKADWDINLATTRLGRLRDGETVTVPFKVKAGVLKLDSILQWDNGWVAYPTNDIDYYLVDPNGTIHAGATLDAPERIVIDNPVAGNWSVILDGFTVHESWGDWYRLRILADGKIVR